MFYFVTIPVVLVSFLSHTCANMGYLNFLSQYLKTWKRLKMKRSRAPSQRAAAAAKKTRATTSLAAAPAKTFGVPRGVPKKTIGLPKQLRMSHRYVENILTASGAGTLSTYLFSCNGLFDPNFSGTGHQPMYFDQMSALYNHYTCLGSKCSVYARIVGNTVPDALVGMYIDDDTTVTPTNSNGCSEQTTAVFAQINSAPAKPAFFSRIWNAKEAFGGDIMDNDNLTGSSAANPTEQQWYVLFAQDANFAGVLTVQWTVVIEYDCVWDELKNLNAS